MSNVNLNYSIFIQENVFKDAFWEIVAILSRGRWVNAEHEKELELMKDTPYLTFTAHTMTYTPVELFRSL